MSKLKQHLFGLDLLRGVAIILMFITHGTRLYLSGVSDFKERLEISVLDRFLNFFLIIEPFTSSLFLFLVGYSLVLSYRNNKEGWYLKNLKRAGQLYALGFLFFFLEKGWQWPDSILSPSILSCIAFSIIVVSSLIQLNNKILWILTPMLIAGVSLFIENKFLVPGLNSGFGGVFPLILFTFLGYIAAKLSNKQLGILIGMSLIAWFIPGEWTSKYPSFYRVFPTGETGIDFIKYLIYEGNLRYYKITFWNHNLIAVARLTAPILISLILLVKFQNLLSIRSYNKAIALLGQNSLALYVIHLAVIAIFDLLHLIPQTAVQAWGFVLLLIVVGLGYSKLKQN